MEVLVLYETAEQGATCTDTNPSAFCLYLSTKQNSVSASELLDQFPFHATHVRLFTLQQVFRPGALESDSDGCYWVEIREPAQRIRFFAEQEHTPLLFLRVEPKINLVGGSSSKANWWQDYLPKTEKRNAHREAQASRERVSAEERKSLKQVSVSITKGTDAMQRGLNTFATWARSGMKDALDFVQSSEAVELKSSRVVLEKKIAEGGFSQVYIARSNSRSYALKKCLAHGAEDLRDLMQEIKLHRAVKCPHVLELIDYGVLPSKHLPGAKEVHLLLPLLNETGSMYDQIEQYHSKRKTRACPWPYPERLAAQLVAGVAQGLQSIHDAGFTHRDVKPHNVLFRATSPATFPDNASHVHPVLMDLGSAAKREVQVKSRQHALMIKDEASVKSSAPYRAPELIEVPVDSTIDEAVDVWSLGCLLYALTYGGGYSPFEHPIQGVLTLSILQGTVNFPEMRVAYGCSYSKEWEELIASMVDVAPGKRPHLKEVKRKLISLSRG